MSGLLAALALATAAPPPPPLAPGVAGDSARSRGAIPPASAAAPSYLPLAERLRQDGQYGPCAVEALREGYAHPETADRADERAALCLDLANRHAEARALLLRLHGDALSAQARFRLCYTEAFLADAPRDELCAPEGAAPSREDARYLVLASYTEVMRSLLARRYEEGAAELAKWPKVPAGTLADWQAQDTEFVTRSRTLPHRSPVLAAFLSAVFPGAGRAYVGRWGDAAISLALVGVPAGFGAYEFTRSGVSSVGGWILASITGLFYLGDVYGSALGAVLFNRQQDDALAAQVKQSYVGRADP